MVFALHSKNCLENPHMKCRMCKNKDTVLKAQERFSVPPSGNQ